MCLLGMLPGCQTGTLPGCRIGMLLGCWLGVLLAPAWPPLRCGRDVVLQGLAKGLLCTQQVSVLWGAAPGGAFGLARRGVPVSWVGVPWWGWEGVNGAQICPAPLPGPTGG